MLRVADEVTRSVGGNNEKKGLDQSGLASGPSLFSAASIERHQEDVMSVDSDKINRAIRECIRQCFGSNAVLARVAAYLDALRLKPDWKELEVRLVEKGVRDMLRGVVTLRKAG